MKFKFNYFIYMYIYIYIYQFTKVPPSNSSPLSYIINNYALASPFNSCQFDIHYKTIPTDYCASECFCALVRLKKVTEIELNIMCTHIN